MKRKLPVSTTIFLSMMWLILSLGSAWSATYYVEPGGSINEACARLQPGDTLLVREGIYRETIQIRVNGLPDNRITIKNYPGEHPIIDGTKIITGWAPCAPNEPGLTVNGVTNPNYANIYKLEVDASDIAYIENVFMLEDGNFLRKAYDPDQSDPVLDDFTEFRIVAPESVGLTDSLIEPNYPYFLDPKPDDYWNGAWIRIKVANQFYTRLIIDYIQGEKRIIFAEPALSLPITADSSYAIINHPHIVDQSGEFYHTTTPVDGRYTIYLWPRDIANLTDKIDISRLSWGFFINSDYGDYVTIEGFEIRGFSGRTWTGGIVVHSPNTVVGADNVIVRNNIVHNIKAHGGISIMGGSNHVVENNIVSNISGGHHGISGAGTNIIARNNFISDVDGTGIYFGYTNNGQMIGNTITGRAGGNHGNGLTVYQNSSNVLVARNRVITTTAALTMEASSNITLFNNIFYGPLWCVVADWGYMTGTVAVLNNVILGSSDINTALALPADSSVKTVKNNIMDGILDHSIVELSHNIYTGRRGSWSLAEGEILADGSGQYDIYDIFVDPDNHDYRLKDKSIAIDAGTDISADLPSYLNDPFFADFDFGLDIEGNPRPHGLAWDIGPYEYALLPAAVIKIEPKEGYVPLTVSFDGSQSTSPNGDIVSYEWDFGDGTSSKGEETLHTYTSPREYTVTLKVTDSLGYQGQAQARITVLKKEKEFGKLPTGCYNNVFNPTKGEKATIIVDLEKRGYIKITLYDTKGNKIKELADEERDAETYGYYWDGKNDSGNAVGSGLYFVHIQSGDRKETKKIVVVK